MLLQRIEAKTLPEALERVRRECGDDALVVETRPTRTGYLVVTARPELAPARRRVDTQSRSLGQAQPKWTRGFQPLAQKALDFGMSERILRAVENALLGTKVALSEPGDPALPGLAARVLQALITTEPRVESPPTPAGGTAKFRTVALVGPTGVGKTTTLAKLAARAVSRGERVGIVTLDTYRVAAVEQLRAFADLLDVPIEIAFTPQDLRRINQQFADRDRVLIDTTGRSPLLRDVHAAQRSMLQVAGAATVLCLAAGTRAADCQLVLANHDPAGIDAVCLTKWDETLVPGEALSTVVERGLGLSHLCIGQEVPADIVATDAADLARAAFACPAPEAAR